MIIFVTTKCYTRLILFLGSTNTILSLLYSLNSCVNPWIYLVFNRELPRLLIRHFVASNKSYRGASDGKSVNTLTS